MSSACAKSGDSLKVRKPGREYANRKSGQSRFNSFLTAVSAPTWQVTRDTLTSQGKHTPFDFGATGTALPGRVRTTVLAGGVSYQANAR